MNYTPCPTKLQAEFLTFRDKGMASLLKQVACIRHEKTDTRGSRPLCILTVKRSERQTESPQQKH